MKVGDVIIDPYVNKIYHDKLNPLYATIYIGATTKYVNVISYKGDFCSLIRNKKNIEDEFKVIGHIDLEEIIIKLVEEHKDDKL